MTEPNPIPLAAPVGQFMRSTITIAAEDSVERAVTELKRNGALVLPVILEGHLVGVVNERCLREAIINGTAMSVPCTAVMVAASTIHPYESGAAALRVFEELNDPALVVVDDHERVMGLLGPSDLFPRRRVPPRPGVVGGMATPFGVYLTNGGVRGGVGPWAVMSTGALMFSLLICCLAAASPLNPILEKSALPVALSSAIEQGIPFIAFLALIRIIPLSGTHGAEHMVVHAIERGEDLTPEIVGRMPRVHPRCGTNIAVGMFLFLAIFTVEWTSRIDVRLLVAVLTTLFLWRPLGSFVQQFITTKKPSPAQLRNGIKAGSELMQRYSVSHSSIASVPQRIWNSGMIQVIAGSLSIWLVLKLISMAFNIPVIEDLLSAVTGTLPSSRI